MSDFKDVNDVLPPSYEYKLDLPNRGVISVREIPLECLGFKNLLRFSTICFIIFIFSVSDCLTHYSIPSYTASRDVYLWAFFYLLKIPHRDNAPDCVYIAAVKAAE